MDVFKHFPPCSVFYGWGMGQGVVGWLRVLVCVVPGVWWGCSEKTEVSEAVLF